MSDTSLIKSITIHSCPHCEKEIFIESQMAPSIVSSLFTKKDIENAKEDCRNQIETLSLDDIKKESVLKWLNDPTTIFGPNEVESIILSLLRIEE